MKTIYTAFVIFIFLFSQNIVANKSNTSGLLNSNELLNINVTTKDELVEINWDAMAFTYNGYFIIERSYNALTFITLDTIFFSSNNQKYLYLDNLPLQDISYYRIRYKSNNEPENISNIFDVELVSQQLNGTFEVMQIFPLPFYESLNTKIKCKVELLITVKVIDINGKLLSEYSKYCNKGINIIEIPEIVNIINDIYYIVILDENLNKKIIHVLKQNHN